METLYRKVSVSERLPKTNGNYFTDKYRSFYFSQELNKFMDDEGDFIYPKYWLEPIPDPAAQLQADKAEMLMMLEKVKMGIFQMSFDQLELLYPKIESLIQKMKQ